MDRHRAEQAHPVGRELQAVVRAAEARRVQRKLLWRAIADSRLFPAPAWSIREAERAVARERQLRDALGGRMGAVALEDEDLDGDVGLQADLREKGTHLPAEDLLDGRDEARLHRPLKGKAGLPDRLPSPPPSSSVRSTGV